MNLARCFLITLLLVACSGVACVAQDFKELPGSDLEIALKSLSESPSFSEEIRKRKENSKSPVLISAVLYERTSPTADGKERIAELVHYVYDSGKTLTTQVDLSDAKVIKMAAREAQSPALAKEERELAIRLARSVSPKVTGWLDAGAERVRTELLVPVVADRAHPLFGHRLCVLTFVNKEAPSQSERIWVDLSVDTAEVDRNKDNSFLRRR